MALGGVVDCGIGGHRIVIEPAEDVPNGVRAAVSLAYVLHQGLTLAALGNVLLELCSLGVVELPTLKRDQQLALRTGAHWLAP
jgi:hypothetical protein